MNLNNICWRSALLGAAVFVAGSAYWGTLVGNVSVWVYLREGLSLQEAYAQLWSQGFSVVEVVGLAADVAFALACGWIAMAQGRGSAIVQGALAGLMAVSFPIIMTFGPIGSSEALPLWRVVASLAIPMLGSIIGASMRVRRS